jgi:hypothetical protein
MKNTPLILAEEQTDRIPDALPAGLCAYCAHTAKPETLKTGDTLCLTRRREGAKLFHIECSFISRGFTRMKHR